MRRRPCGNGGGTEVVEEILDGQARNQYLGRDASYSVAEVDIQLSASIEDECNDLVENRLYMLVLLIARAILR